MNWFLRLSLKTKLTIIILTVTLVAVGTGCTVMLLIELAHRKQEIVANALLIAQTTGAYVAADIASADKQAARESLDILKGNPDIINIHIYDAKGRLFMSLYGDSSAPSSAPPAYSVKITNDGLYVSEPLKYKGQNYGAIYQIMSIVPTKQQKIHQIIAVALLILGISLISFLIAKRLQAVISVPIVKLIDIAKQISQQNSFTLRATTNLKDEIGELYESFNQLMDRIQEHEAELQYSEEKLRAVTENTPDTIMLVDEEGKILFINRTLPEFTREEVLNRNIIEFVPPRSQQAIRETFHEVLRTGLPRDFEVEYESPQGVNIYESRVGPIKNSRITGFTISSRDITRRKVAEMEKARAIKRLAILRSLDEAILKAQSPEAIAKAALENINALVPTRRSSVTLFDMPKKEIVALAECGVSIGMAEGERLPLDSVWGDIEDLKKGVVHTVDDIASLADRSSLASKLSGLGIKAFHNIPLLANGSLVGTLNLGAATSAAFSQEEIDIATEIADVLAIALEQARLKEEIQRDAEQMEQGIKERTAELEAANKELESFSYSVSHDLRAPLRSIDGFSQMILDEYKDSLDQQGADYLRRVRNASQRMGRLIDDMLTLSRVNRSAITRQLVSVDRLAKVVINALRENEPDRNVVFIVRGEINAYADPELLRVVLENLLGNAWKFTSHKPHAVIEIGEHKSPVKHEGETTIYVKDNGAGFDMNYAGKLFGAFQRLHSEEEFGGTGIGLASAQRIIHRHGGEIWAEGEVDTGAVFYFTLGKADEKVEPDMSTQYTGTP